ncbi:MAG: 50S ribosomal protein L11 methyltransferase [Chloroflexota bacterium]
MDWLEMALRVEAELAETIAAQLASYGYKGVVLERDDIPDTDPWDEGNIPPPMHQVVRVYLPHDDDVAVKQQELIGILSHYPVEEPVFRDVQEQDWAEAWKVHYHTLRLGQRLVIRPEWESAEIGPDDVEIVLDPGMAFGTGTHPTTQLCMEAVERLLETGDSVVDLGCGSGILAIAAAKLGAGDIFAIDNDAVAAESARENLTRNHVSDRIELATGSLADVLVTGKQFDFALVNILARVIIPMCDEGLGNIVKPGGKAIFSGLIESQTEDVEAALIHTGLQPQKRVQMGDWMLIEAMRTV